MIYFIQDTETRAVKIGFSENVKHRLTQLQTSCPHKLQLLIAIPGTQQMEKMLHRVFKQYGLMGEWFAESESLLAMVDFFQALNKQSVKWPKQFEASFEDIAKTELVLRDLLKFLFGDDDTCTKFKVEIPGLDTCRCTMCRWNDAILGERKKA